jgi:hypothetical protein
MDESWILDGWIFVKMDERGQKWIPTVFMNLFNVPYK